MRSLRNPFQTKNNNKTKHIPSDFSFRCDSHHLNGDQTHWLPYNSNFYYGNCIDLIEWGRSVLFKSSLSLSLHFILCWTVHGTATAPTATNWTTHGFKRSNIVVYCVKSGCWHALANENEIEDQNLWLGLDLPVIIIYCWYFFCCSRFSQVSLLLTAQCVLCMTISTRFFSHSVQSLEETLRWNRLK